MGKGREGVGRSAAVARLTPISGCGGKGPACFLVETADARVLLDLGYGPQPGLKPDVSSVGAVDALLLSHSHPDHAGALDLLPHVGNPRVYATHIVKDLIGPRDGRDTLPLTGRTEICGIRVTTGRNGHAPGGVWIHLDVGAGLLYMGDCSTESMLYAFDSPPAADTVILDASYGTYDAPLEACVDAFDRVFDGGPVLLPVPAAGRGPEIALHAARSGRVPHVDDAVRAALEALLGGYRESMHADCGDDVARLARHAPPIRDAEGIMLAARGDASGGEAARLANLWESEPMPAIVFSGYLPPGTAAERLTRSGRARYLRWNVHPTLSHNARLVRETCARTVLPAFGDSRHAPAWQSAFAPARVALEAVPL